MTRRFSVAICASLLTALVLACAPGCRRGAEKKENVASQETARVAVTVAAVERRQVQRIVRTVGTLNGFEELTLEPKVEGRVVRVYHETGDRVAPGEPLVEIDPTDFRLAVEEARQALALELARLGVAAPPADDFDVRELPSVVRAQLLLDNAQRQKDRIEQLEVRSAVTQQQIDQVDTDQQVAAANLQQTLLEAHAALAGARHRRAALAMAEQKLADARIVAPPFPSLGAGESQATEYVVAERMVSEGEMVRTMTRTPLVRLVIDQPLKLRGLCAERYMDEVRPGETVLLRVDAFGDEWFQGELKRVEPTIDPTSRTFIYEAWVQNSEHRLKAGGFAKVAIQTRLDPQATTVPIEAIVAFAGVTKVFRVVDSRVQAVEVELGERGRGWVEILGGLNEGDSVVTSGQTRLVDGGEIQVRSEPAAQVAERAP